MIDNNLALVQAFVSRYDATPAEIIRTYDGAVLEIIVRPKNSNRTLRIVATVTDAVEL